MKLLHTADVHLGARFAVLGEEKGRAQRLQLQRTFESIGELAVSERVDAMIVAGDLFDTNAPSASSIDVARRVLAQVAGEGIRVFVIPGTHDCYDFSSVWRTIDVATLPGVTVFTDETGPVTVGELDLTVYGLVHAAKKAPAGALRSMKRTTDNGVHVGIVHGSLAIPDILEDDSLLFTADEAAATAMDYLALGHWHSFRQERFGDVVACYPGSPEFVSVDQKGAGQVALVTIDREGKVSVEGRQVGVRRFDELEVALDTLSSPAQVAEAIRAKADPDLVLEVTLTGLCAFDFDIDAEELAVELESDFFHLRLRDRSHPRLDDVAIAELPEGSVVGKFARIMRERIESAERDTRTGDETTVDENVRDEKAVYEEALRLGVALLEGKQVFG